MRAFKQMTAFSPLPALFRGVRYLRPEKFLYGGFLLKSVILALVFLFVVVSNGQSLSVPLKAELGTFSEWVEYVHTFTIANNSNLPVKLLRVRASCGCIGIQFTPIVLAPGAESTVKLTIPPGAFTDKFETSIFLETDAPGQKFIRMKISGTAVPAVAVEPKRKVFLGGLEVGVEQSFKFRLVPSKPEMSLVILQNPDTDGGGKAVLTPNADGISYTLEFKFTPTADYFYKIIQRNVAIKGVDEMPPVTLSVNFTPSRFEVKEGFVY